MKKRSCGWCGVKGHNTRNCVAYLEAQNETRGRRIIFNGKEIYMMAYIDGIKDHPLKQYKGTYKSKGKMDFLKKWGDKERSQEVKKRQKSNGYLWQLEDPTTIEGVK
jgi:hypothetical protein